MSRPAPRKPKSFSELKGQGSNLTARGEEVLLNRRNKSEAATVGATMLQRLETMDDALSSGTSYTGASRWMVPYADILTVLIGLFIVLYALVAADNSEMEAATSQYQQQAAHHQAIATEQQKEIRNLRVAIASLANSSTPSQSDELIPGGSIRSVDELEAQLKARLKQAHIQGLEFLNIHQEDRGVVISMTEDLLFDPGHATMTANASKTLDEVAGVLAGMPNPIRIEGHTDNRPIATTEFPSNWELSTARATGIVRYLTRTHKFPPQQLSAVGYGEYRPMVSNDTATGRQKNRRVDLVVLNGEANRWEPDTPKIAPQ